MAGVGSSERTYRVLFDKFIEGRVRTVYEPQEKNPSGEVHEELALYSCDESAETIVLREFHTEGMVITYRLASTEPDPVFESTEIENGPPGLRARVTLHRDAAGGVEEVFELAPAGKPFEECIRSRLTRVG